MDSKRLPQALTYAGTIPFLATAVLLVSKIASPLGVDFLKQLFITYGVVILTFLAGMHWGIAISTKSPLTRALFLTSNVIALTAWLVILLNNPLVASIILLVGFIIELSIDLKLSKIHAHPDWFIQVRKNATMIVCFAHVLFIIGLYR